MRAARTGLTRFGVAVTIALLPVLPLVYACVDGVTPNCADPAVQCGPEVDASGDQVEAALLPEVAAMDSAPEASPDAPDADLDAGDEG